MGGQTQTALSSSPRSWPEDYEHENGCYLNQCYACDQMFIGHKRRIGCKLCSAPETPTAGKDGGVAENLERTRITLGQARTPAYGDALASLRRMERERDELKNELERLREIDRIGGEADARNREEIANLKTGIRDTLAENAELLKDKARFDALIELTNRESSDGEWRATLDYDNYQDGARILDGDGNVVGLCYDVEKTPEEQFRAALDGVIEGKEAE